MPTINISATTNGGSNCSSNSGVTVSGVLATDTVTFKEIVGTYTAWHAWNGVTNCTDANGCAISAGKTGWLNNFNVCAGGVETNCGSANKCFPTAANAKAAWDALYPDGVSFTGQTSYVVFIKDVVATDNQGGISLEYTVENRVSNAIMFSCNT